jgi:hypothetical protein
MNKILTGKEEEKELERKNREFLKTLFENEFRESPHK